MGSRGNARCRAAWRVASTSKTMERCPCRSQIPPMESFVHPWAKLDCSKSVRNASRQGRSTLARKRLIGRYFVDSGNTVSLLVFRWPMTPVSIRSEITQDDCLGLSKIPESTNYRYTNSLSMWYNKGKCMWKGMNSINGTSNHTSGLTSVDG